MLDDDGYNLPVLVGFYDDVWEVLLSFCEFPEMDVLRKTFSDVDEVLESRIGNIVSEGHTDEESVGEFQDLDLSREAGLVYVENVYDLTDDLTAFIINNTYMDLLGELGAIEMVEKLSDLIHDYSNMADYIARSAIKNWDPEFMLAFLSQGFDISYTYIVDDIVWRCCNNGDGPLFCKILEIYFEDDFEEMADTMNGKYKRFHFEEALCQRKEILQEVINHGAFPALLKYFDRHWDEYFKIKAFVEEIVRVHGDEGRRMVKECKFSDSLMRWLPS